MDNKDKLPHAEGSGQEMVNVDTLGAAFYDKGLMGKAALLCGGSKETVLFAWCKIMLMRGELAKVHKNADALSHKIQMEKRFVETSGFRAMERAGMIVITDENTKSELTVDDFEQFWQSYPTRRSTGGGAITRGSKQNAKRMFDMYITSRNQYAMMMSALPKYKLACGNFPKDAERFLRQNFYVDYLPDKTEIVSGVVNLAATELSDTEKQRIQDDREQRLRQVTGDGEGRADNVGVGATDAGLDAVSGG